MDYLKKNDRLSIVLDIAYAGENWIEPRLEWYEGLRNINTQDNFEFSSDVAATKPQIKGSWWSDDGDLAMPLPLREPRIICKKGSCHFTVDPVTSNAVYLRVFLNPNFGTGNILVNGSPPSTIAGLTNTRDVFDCDAASHGSFGNEYKDLLLFSVADNTVVTQPLTITLEMANTETGTSGFVPIAGYKTLKNLAIGEVNTLTVDLDNWILPAGTSQNNTGFVFENQTTLTVADVSVAFPAGFKDTADGVTEVGNLAATSLFAQEALNGPAQVVVDWPTDDYEGSESKEIVITTKYPDSNGTESILTTSEFKVDNSNITYTPEINWYSDVANGELRKYTNTNGSTLEFVSAGDSLDIRVQKDFGWGVFEIYSDDVLIGTGSCHDPVGGAFYEWLPTYTGLGPGEHNIKIVNVNSPNKFTNFAAFKFSSTELFTPITETLRINYTKKHIEPKLIDTFAFNGTGYDMAMNDNAEKDLTVPFDNTNLEELETVTRFPTYCVYYSNGKMDILSKYDMVVVDPFAVSRKQVKELQDKGIIVFVYISFGEEDSTLADIYDPGSEIVPWAGDGQGPGGYAGYYSKGGNWFEEQSACAKDRRRYEGITACADSRPEYWAEPGRCGPACTNDFREGYKSQQAGLACGGGYTINDNWQRTASVACQNNTCPGYDPMNANCPNYQKSVNSWGQDFSIMTTDFPDENGIWGSYYVDVTKPSPIDPNMSAWEYRIRDYYLPMLFNGPQKHVVYRATQTKVITEGTILGIQISDYPIDDLEEMILEIHDGPEAGRILIQGQEYAYDPKLATFRISPPEDGAWSITEGTYIKVTFHRKGLNADGVFMDTVDTVDVYPSPEYKAAFIKMINDMKATYPERLFCSNRGFSILDDIIGSCSHVMFETFVSEYDWETGEYYELDNPDTVEWNNSIIDQLIRLRRDHTYDVLALNYASNGPEGEALRASIAERCRDLGFISWTSTILLNDPLPNTVVESPKSPIKTNDWRRIDAINIS